MVLSVILLVVVVGAIAVALSQRAGSPSTGNGEVTQDPATGSAEVVNDQMMFDDVERFYRLYVPSSISAGSAVPLLIALHGNGTDEQGFAELSGLDETAAQEGFLVVYPRAVEGVWNGGFSQRTRSVDDVGFLIALVDELSTRYSIDTERVFATGLSAGGIMTYRLACEAPELVSAIAPVAATMAVECNPASPVGVLHIHGTDDPAIPIEGRQDRGSPPVATVVDAWRVFDGCDDEPQVDTEGAAAITRSSGCESGTAVHFYSVEGMGHEYPRRDDGDALDAREVSWAFFTEHARTVDG